MCVHCDLLLHWFGVARIHFLCRYRERIKRDEVIIRSRSSWSLNRFTTLSEGRVYTVYTVYTYYLKLVLVPIISLGYR